MDKWLIDNIYKGILILIYHNHLYTYYRHGEHNEKQ